MRALKERTWQPARLQSLVILLLLAVRMLSTRGAEDTYDRESLDFNASERVLLPVNQVLTPAVDLSRAQYEALHDGVDVEGLSYTPTGEFRIARVGKSYETSFQDLGVEYYEYVS